MHQATRPLFRFDPGWLFIAAGLSMCAAVMILPVQTDLHDLRVQLEQLRNEETRAYARLKAHSDFMDQVDRADPALIRRLAATQLNMVPEGDTPVLLAASASVPVTHWIESAVKVDMRPPRAAADTILSKLVNGPYRLWIFGGGIMAVFFGVLLGTHTVNARRAVEAASPVEDDMMLAADVDRGNGLALAIDEIEAANELLTAEQVTGRNEIPIEVLCTGRKDDDDDASTDGVVPEIKIIEAPTTTVEVKIAEARGDGRNSTNIDDGRDSDHDENGRGEPDGADPGRPRG